MIFSNAPIVICLKLFCFFTISSFISHGQNVGDIHLVVEGLMANEDVLGVNRIIKENPSLDITYKYKTLNQCLELALEHQSPEELEDCYLSLGNFWHTQDHKIMAFTFYLKCDSIAKRHDHFRVEGMALMNRASLLDDGSLRVEMCLESIKAFAKTDDKLNLAKSHLNTGVAYSTFFNGLDPLDTLNDRGLSAQYEYHRTMMFNHYSIADSIGYNINNLQIRSAVMIYYAEWYEYVGKLNLARKYYDEAQVYCKESGFQKGETYCILQSALIEDNLGNKRSMMKGLARAESLSIKNNYNDYLLSIYNQYVMLHERDTKFALAYDYQKKLTDVKLELMRSGNREKLKILELQNKLFENTIVMQRLEQKEESNRAALVFSIFVSILVASLAYLGLKNKRKRIAILQNTETIANLEKAAVETELKNTQLKQELLKEKVRFGKEQLRVFANQLVKIDEFLDSLKLRVEGLGANVENQRVVNDLKISFAKLIEGQDSIAQINSYTSELNQEFFFYVKKNFESVTRDDEILLAYVLLGMDSKEIGRILNITTESVYKKRYRLRRKLKLEKETLIIDFYQAFVAKLEDDPLASNAGSNNAIQSN